MKLPKKLDSLRRRGLRNIRRAAGRIRGTEPRALVEVFDEQEIVGWIAVPSGHESREVALYVNEVQVALAVASQAVERKVPFPIRQFRLRLNSLWKYCGPDDVLSVRAEGRLIHIAGFGTHRAPPSPSKSRVRQLAKKLATGHVFNQKGFLQLSKAADDKWQGAVFDLYDRIRAQLKERFALDLMVIYGTLLGAIRTKDFITRDHDFDVGFFSRARTPEEAKEESARVIRALLDAGYHVHVKPSCFYVSDPASGNTSIDFGRLYFDTDGNLQSAFGFAGSSNYTLASHTGYQEVPLHGHTVLTVNNPEDLLACIYGGDWRIPNPGFEWNRDRLRRSSAARFTQAEISELTRR